MTYDKKTPMFKIYTTGQPTKNLEFLNLCSRSQPFILMLLFKLQGAACHGPSRGQPPAVPGPWSHLTWSVRAPGQSQGLSQKLLTLPT